MVLAAQAVIRDRLGPVLERPSATLDDSLGGTATKVFVGRVQDRDVAIHVFKEGPYSGQIGTAVIPGPQQRIKWGLAP